jgi:acyl dehydratase|tara:strand:- start:1006 stop:1485 length:480 start_codon:yes stop_codon:yes gene_type:complete
MSMYWEEFEVGKRYGTYGRTVTEGDLSLFCAFVGYHVPLFIDEEYAKGTQFGGRIAPSSFTMSVSTAMTESLFRDTVISLLSVERGRFLAPVRAGDTIRTEVEVLSKRETRNPEKGIVTFRDHVLNQHGETVFEIDKIVMLKRRAGQLRGDDARTGSDG